MSITDGGPGDSDGMVNRIIVDPSCPALSTASGGDTGSGDSGAGGGTGGGGSVSGGGGGGSGGCFITNVARGYHMAEAFSALSLLLGFFIICIVGCRRRFKK